MKRLGFSLLTGSVLVLSGLTGCASAPSGDVTESAVQPVAEDAAGASADTVAQNNVENNSDTESTAERDESQQRPQLIKRASLVLKVESVEDAFEQVRSLINTQQGDILSMQDQGETNRNVSLELRVPQSQLDATLEGLSEIGTTQHRAITSEDVSSQLIDLQARLSNARKSEEALKEIMSRSGDISDVLEVSRELSNVRQEIEQMAAVQESLQTQVRYSTITLNLESAIATSPIETPFAQQLSSTWTSATHSFGNFTTDLLQLGLWLLVYSPYIFLLLGGAVLVNKLRDSASTDL